MALESVTKEIEASAQEEVAKINAQRDAEIDAIRRETESKIAEIKSAQEKTTQGAFQTLARQEISSADLESKKRVLLQKKKMLSKAFDAALQHLEDMSSDKKLECYRAMLKKASPIVSSPNVVLSPGDGFTAEDLGVPSVETSDAVRAGMILRSEDGSVEVDLQFAVLLRSIWDRNLKAVSDILFG